MAYLPEDELLQVKYTRKVSVCPGVMVIPVGVDKSPKRQLSVLDEVWLVGKKISPVGGGFEPLLFSKKPYPYILVESETKLLLE